MQVLVVDDEKSVADTLVLILKRAGHKAAAVYDGASALKLVETFRPECVISDVIMPGISGIEVCEAIENRYPKCHIMLFSGQGSSNELVEKAREAGHNWELLGKPIEPDELLQKIAA